ncbi:MAG: hypothetical protein ACE5H4_07660 [Candidatus Thorarchaeota archaeon]
MTGDEKLTDNEFHKKIVKKTNNGIWPVLDNSNPSAEELEQALHMAHIHGITGARLGQLSMLLELSI